MDLLYIVFVLLGTLVMVKCGCFEGIIEEFKKEHGENKYAKQYTIAIASAQILHVT